MFWQRSNSEHKWLEIEREGEGSGWKIRNSRILYFCLGQKVKVESFNCELTKMPSHLFPPFPHPGNTHTIHTYVYVYFVHEIEEEEGRRRE